ncbi:MAG: hypothetical protein LLG04_15745, partial [Parachlamydia sp.]|nr:hypothetical protein [Parachlamydia sp.]
MQGLNEAVEVYLYCEIALREKLGLLTFSESMHYSDLGRSEWIDLRQLAKEVNATYLDQVVQIPVFEKIFLEDPSVQLEMQKLKEDFDKLVESFGECPVGAELDSEVLDWYTRMGECSAAYETSC